MDHVTYHRQFSKTYPKVSKRYVLDFKNDHDRLVYKDRLYHRAVAKKLRADPSLLSIPKNNLTRWMAMEKEQGNHISYCNQEWLHILNHCSLEQILEILEGDTEETDRLQHGSPFAGVLSQEERNSIYISERESIPA